MSEEEKEVLAMFNSVGLNIEADNEAAALWFSLGSVFVKKIIALRTQLERYREALSKIVEVGYGWTGSGSAGKMKLIHLASEALETKGVE